MRDRIRRIGKTETRYSKRRTTTLSAPRDNRKTDPHAGKTDLFVAHGTTTEKETKGVVCNEKRTVALQGGQIPEALARYVSNLGVS